MQGLKVGFKNKFRRSLSMSALAALIVCTSVSAKADSTRDFMLSATYGTLAGTLVGAASLAFSERPGENLNQVARGASLGLYVGILLGLYVVYGSSGPADDDTAGVVLLKPAPDLFVAPVFSDRGVAGAQANYTFLRF